MIMKCDVKKIYDKAKTCDEKKLFHFLKIGVWRIRLHQLSPAKKFFLKQLRIILLVWRKFREDHCQLQAASLTYYTLLSIVPVIAMAFGIAKGFGLEKILEKQLLGKFPGQEEVLTYIINFAHSLLENTKGGVVAGIGVTILFWTIIKVLGTVEESFNAIWNIKKSRTLRQKFSDYLSVMLVCPILIITSSSITVFISFQLTRIAEQLSTFGGIFGFFVFFLIKFLPYCMIWILFIFIYGFMPNTKVNFKSAVFAGLVAGTIYEFTQWMYINFQIGTAKYNAVYGSFAALPLFLAWLQLSWSIVLLGAEISYAEQNIDKYEFESDSHNISHSFRKLLFLSVTHCIVKNFSSGNKPLTIRQISNALEIPICMVEDILAVLIKHGIVSQLCLENSRESSYQPGVDINRLSLSSVLAVLEYAGDDTVISPVHNKETTLFSQTLDNFHRIIENSPENKLLKDM